MSPVPGHVFEKYADDIEEAVSGITGWFGLENRTNWCGAICVCVACVFMFRGIMVPTG